MKIKVIVKPNAKKNEVIKNDRGEFVIRVTVPPIEGKANEKMIEVLAEYFNTSKRSISIISGFSSKIKIVELLG